MVGIAGLTRDAPGLGEAFTMLTTEPGEDVAPYHGRQVALVPPADWRSLARLREARRRPPEGLARRQPQRLPGDGLTTARQSASGG